MSSKEGVGLYAVHITQGVLGHTTLKLVCEEQGLHLHRVTNDCLELFGMTHVDVSITGTDIFGVYFVSRPKDGMLQVVAVLPSLGAKLNGPACFGSEDISGVVNVSLNICNLLRAFMGKSPLSPHNNLLLNFVKGSSAVVLQRALVNTKVRHSEGWVHPSVRGGIHYINTQTHINIIEDAQHNEA